MAGAADVSVSVCLEVEAGLNLPTIKDAISKAGWQFVLTQQADDLVTASTAQRTTHTILIAQVPSLDPSLDRPAYSLSGFFRSILQRERRGIRTIALTYAHPRSVLYDIRQSLAAGCVERDLRLLHQLPVALRTVAMGGVFWGDHMPGPEEADSAPLLSPREQRLLAELMRNPNLNPVQLSSHMGVSPTTTYRRIKSICEKLGVRTPLAAILAAQQRGLLPSL